MCSPLASVVGRIGAAVTTVMERALEAAQGQYAAVTSALLLNTLGLMEAEGSVRIPRRNVYQPLGKSGVGSLDVLLICLPLTMTYPQLG
jgi:hypothetical protein